jgi:hypothetical protein
VFSDAIQISYACCSLSSPAVGVQYVKINVPSIVIADPAFVYHNYRYWKMALLCARLAQYERRECDKKVTLNRDGSCTPSDS